MTPAISDGSRSLSAACWRMTSSWRSGSVSSCTALSAHGLSDSTRDRDQRDDQRQQRRAPAPDCARERRPPRAAAGGGAGVCVGAHELSFARTADSFCSNSSSVPEFSTAYVARCAFSCLRELARVALVDRLVAAGARRARPGPSSSATTAIVASKAALQPGLEQQRHLDDERRRRRVARGLGARHSAIRSPTRGQSRPSSHARSSGVANARRATAARSTTPLGRHLGPPARDDRRRGPPGRRRARGPPRRWTAWPRRDAPARRVPPTCPAPMPPVRPDERRRAQLSSARLGLGLRRPRPRASAPRASASASAASALDLGASAASATSAASGSASATSAASARPRRPPRPRRPRRRPLRPSAGARRRRPRTGPSSGMSSRSPASAAAVRRGSTWPSTRLIDSERRRRSESISRILTFTSSPGWTISRGFSTCCCGELGDVHEALDALQDLHERAERDDLGDRALELVTHVVGVDDALPRILLGLLEAQGDALAVAVDVEHLDLRRCRRSRGSRSGG